MTETDVARMPDMGKGAMTGASLDARIRYAQTLAASNLLPDAYRQQPANVLVAVETGSMLGVHPIAALNGINVIKGKPTISPALMTALVRRAGHRVRVRVSGTVAAGDLSATVEVIRSDDPDFVYSATWTLDRAERAGLLTSQTYQKYPEAMLKARATSEVCREAAEEALCGVHYTPEELGATVNEDGDVLRGEVVPPRDFRREADACTDPDELRMLWLAAGEAGVLDATLQAHMKARAAIIAPEAATAEPHTAEPHAAEEAAILDHISTVHEALSTWDESAPRGVTA